MSEPVWARLGVYRGWNSPSAKKLIFRYTSATFRRKQRLAAARLRIMPYLFPKLLASNHQAPLSRKNIDISKDRRQKRNAHLNLCFCHRSKLKLAFLIFETCENSKMLISARTSDRNKRPDMRPSDLVSWPC